jgi:hemolysin III
MNYRFPEPTSGFTHLVGALLSAVGLAWLVILTRDEPGKLVSMVVYGVSLVLLYSASSALHLIDGSARIRRLLNRFDHAAIYLLIAGTYTPFCYNVLSGKWRWEMLGAIWSLAVFGILYKLFCRWRRSTSTLYYIVMGWLGIVLVPVVLNLLPVGALLLILGGGIVYTIGGVIFALDKPNLHRYFNAHDLWHIFVMGGSVLHFAAIVLYIA